MSHTDTWKAAERAIAARLNGRRTSNQGLGSATADVETPTYAVECKHRQSLPGWLLDAVAQARRNAPRGKTPLVVLHEAGGRYDDALVVIDLKTFQELWGD